MNAKLFPKLENETVDQTQINQSVGRKGNKLQQITHKRQKESYIEIFRDKMNYLTNGAPDINISKYKPCNHDLDRSKCDHDCCGHYRGEGTYSSQRRPKSQKEEHSCKADHEASSINHQNYSHYIGERIPNSYFNVGHSYANRSNYNANNYPSIEEKTSNSKSQPNIFKPLKVEEKKLNNGSRELKRVASDFLFISQSNNNLTAQKPADFSLNFSKIRPEEEQYDTNIGYYMDSRIMSDHRNDINSSTFVQDLARINDVDELLMIKQIVDTKLTTQSYLNISINGTNENKMYRTGMPIRSRLGQRSTDETTLNRDNPYSRSAKSLNNLRMSSDKQNKVRFATSSKISESRLLSHPESQETAVRYMHRPLHSNQLSPANVRDFRPEFQEPKDIDHSNYTNRTPLSKSVKDGRLDTTINNRKVLLTDSSGLANSMKSNMGYEFNTNTGSDELDNVKVNNSGEIRIIANNEQKKQDSSYYIQNGYKSNDQLDTTQKSSVLSKKTNLINNNSSKQILKSNIKSVTKPITSAEKKEFNTLKPTNIKKNVITNRGSRTENSSELTLGGRSEQESINTINKSVYSAKKLTMTRNNNLLKKPKHTPSSSLINEEKPQPSSRAHVIAQFLKQKNGDRSKQGEINESSRLSPERSKHLDSSISMIQAYTSNLMDKSKLMNSFVLGEHKLASNRQKVNQAPANNDEKLINLDESRIEDLPFDQTVHDFKSAQITDISPIKLNVNYSGLNIPEDSDDLKIAAADVKEEHRSFEDKTQTQCELETVDTKKLLPKDLNVETVVSENKNILTNDLIGSGDIVKKSLKTKSNNRYSDDQYETIQEAKNNVLSSLISNEIKSIDNDEISNNTKSNNPPSEKLDNTKAPEVAIDVKSNFHNKTSQRLIESMNNNDNKDNIDHILPEKPNIKMKGGNKISVKVTTPKDQFIVVEADKSELDSPFRSQAQKRIKPVKPVEVSYSEIDDDKEGFDGKVVEEDGSSPAKKYKTKIFYPRGWKEREDKIAPEEKQEVIQLVEEMTSNISKTLGKLAESIEVNQAPEPNKEQNNSATNIYPKSEQNMLKSNITASLTSNDKPEQEEVDVNPEAKGFNMRSKINKTSINNKLAEEEKVDFNVEIEEKLKMKDRINKLVNKDHDDEEEVDTVMNIDSKNLKMQSKSNKTKEEKAEHEINSESLQFGISPVKLEDNSNFNIEIPTDRDQIALNTIDKNDNFVIPDMLNLSKSSEIPLEFIIETSRRSSTSFRNTNPSIDYSRVHLIHDTEFLTKEDILNKSAGSNRTNNLRNSRGGAVDLSNLSPAVVKRSSVRRRKDRKKSSKRAIITKKSSKLGVNKKLRNISNEKVTINFNEYALSPNFKRRSYKVDNSAFNIDPAYTNKALNSESLKITTYHSEFKPYKTSNILIQESFQANANLREADPSRTQPRIIMRSSVNDEFTLRRVKSVETFNQSEVLNANFLSSRLNSVRELEGDDVETLLEKLKSKNKQRINIQAKKDILQESAASLKSNSQAHIEKLKSIAGIDSISIKSDKDLLIIPFERTKSHAQTAKNFNVVIRENDILNRAKSNNVAEQYQSISDGFTKLRTTTNKVNVQSSIIHSTIKHKRTHSNEYEQFKPRSDSNRNKSNEEVVISKDQKEVVPNKKPERLNKTNNETDQKPVNTLAISKPNIVISTESNPAIKLAQIKKTTTVIDPIPKRSEEISTSKTGTQLEILKRQIETGQVIKDSNNQPTRDTNVQSNKRGSHHVIGDKSQTSNMSSDKHLIRINSGKEENIDTKSYQNINPLDFRNNRANLNNSQKMMSKAEFMKELEQEEDDSINIEDLQITDEILYRFQEEYLGKMEFMDRAMLIRFYKKYLSRLKRQKNFQKLGLNFIGFDDKESRMTTRIKNSQSERPQLDKLKEMLNINDKRHRPSAKDLYASTKRPSAGIQSSSNYYNQPNAPRGSGVNLGVNAKPYYVMPSNDISGSVAKGRENARKSANNINIIDSFNF